MAEMSKTDIEPKWLSDLPECWSSRPALRANISYALKTGKIRKIAKGLYTKDLDTPLPKLVRANIYQIIYQLYGNAILDGRTALDGVPAADGSVFVIADKSAKAVLPGCTIYPRRGNPALPEDSQNDRQPTWPTTARALIENMLPSNATPTRVSRTYKQSEIEEFLERYLERSGEDGLNRLRDAILQTGGALDMEEQAEQLSKLIGTLLGTRDATMTSRAGQQRKLGSPIDMARLTLFETLQQALHAHEPIDRPDPVSNAARFALLPFYEAYFSNYIEGTEFEVSVARDIIFKDIIPENRTEDAHDVSGTWQVVNDPRTMTKKISSADAFLEQLRIDHRSVMQAHPGKNPGMFKQHANAAGTSVFVSPEKVNGTLEAGFEIMERLKGGFRRAIFAMFMVSEVHPFADGNGRVARIAMNRELSAHGQARIIIPTVYRTTYLRALKAMTNNANTHAIIRMLDRAQRWTHRVEWGDWEPTYQTIAGSNAFMDATEADDKSLRLEDPV